jgi:phage anti-repressor protein/Fe-S-cluster formation regulator IscX/YfhJ
MDILIKKNPSELITSETINFTELVRNSNTSLSINCESNMIKILNEEFTESQQQWYIANLYIYMNYHPTNDYPINLEHVFKMIGFANKENAKRTLKNNFTKDEDYKTVLVRTDENLNGKDLGGRPTENVMLNVDTFKNLCMLAKTDKGKEIRKYYVKLENIHNKIIKQEIEEQKQLLLEKETQLENKDLENKRKVEMTLRNSFNKRNLVYLIKIPINDEIVYKFGHTDDIITRLRAHKNQISEDIELVYCIESKDRKMLERLLIDYLEQYKFRIKRNINDKHQTELLKVNDIQIIKNKLIELNKDIENEKLLIIKLKNKIIDLENENIELKRKLLKDEYVNELKNKIENLEKTILDYKLDDGDDKIKPFIENEDTIEDRIYKKRQVDKIDPTTLNVIETYECINSIIVNNPDLSYNQIYRSIKKNNVYKDFRWNYHGEKINPTNKIVIDGNKIENVIQLDKNKKFVKIYPTKSELCKLLHIGLVKLNRYIEEEKILNEFYYIHESSYDSDKQLLPYEFVNYEIHNSKQIKETNTETNEIIIYQTMKELYEKRGISRCTLRNCIKNNRVCDKYKWEYVNDTHNKNNSKKVKETNIETNEISVYNSMKLVYSKLNITLEKLRSIINNKEIINDCKYEFY